MKPTHQHLGPYALPSFLVQWKDKLYKGQPLHLHTRIHPFSSTQLYFSSNSLLSLSIIKFPLSLCWILPIREQTDQVYSSFSLHKDT